MFKRSVCLSPFLFHTRTHVCAHMHICTHTFTYIHSCHAHTHIYMHVYAHTLTYTHTYTPSHIHPHTHTCSLGPEYGVPEKLVLVFGHLCFSCLVAMETNSNSSLDVTFTELTNHMLILSQPVTQAVIYKFQGSTTGK